MYKKHEDSVVCSVVILGPHNKAFGKKRHTEHGSFGETQKQQELLWLPEKSYAYEMQTWRKCGKITQVLL